MSERAAMTLVSWRTRLTWALVGAGAALAIERIGHDPRKAPPADGAVVAVGEPASAPMPAPAVPPPAPTPMTASTLEASTTDAEASASGTDVADLEASASGTDVADLEASASGTEASPSAPEPAPVPAFEIPLPRMPGARIMKRGQQPSEEHGGVVHTLALSVPAPGAQVEAFYRSALADARLAVSGGSTQPTSLGSGHRSSLRGRGRDASVHVNIQQRAGTLRTTVRILWRPL
jgi:hypothetical protein